MGDFSARGMRTRGLRSTIPLPRTTRIVAGFLIAGLVGLIAYFLPVFQSASTPIITSHGGLINPVVAGPTHPFTVLLLGSDIQTEWALAS